MSLFKKLILSLLFFFAVGFVSAIKFPAIAQENFDQLSQPILVEAVVTNIKSSGQESFLDQLVPYQEIEVTITSSERRGESLVVKNSAAFADVTSQYETYQVNDKIKVSIGKDFEDREVYGIAGKIKRHGLARLGILFVIVVLVVGRFWGAMSLIGLAISFLVIFRLIVPMIISGINPVFAALIGSAIIIPATFYVAHGINKKTHVGVISTLITLAVTGLLAVYFVNQTYLTGYASEEAGFLQVERQGTIDIKGILLAGIIIGALGILDDVTVGQASVIKQLKISNPKIKFWALFKKGMAVGQDHIASMVNTLVLVYSGASLPLLLLFFDSEKSFLDILEFELIAEEIVKMLVGSIGLVLAAPLATLMAAYVFSKDKNIKQENERGEEPHAH